MPNLSLSYATLYNPLIYKKPKKVLNNEKPKKKLSKLKNNNVSKFRKKEGILTFNNNASVNKKGKGKSSSNLKYINVVMLITNPI